MLTWMPVLKIGRDATTGRFVSVAKARCHPRTTVVETIRYRPRPVGVRNAETPRRRRRRPHSQW
jgi:hypothetical protein